MNNIRWDDLVFSNRNQSYGAYVLRKMYPNRVTLSFVLSLAVVTTILASPIIKSMIGSDSIKEVRKTDDRVVVLGDVPPIKVDPPIHIEAPKVKQLEYVAPKVTEQDVADVPPTIQELQDAVVSTETSDGNVTFVEAPAITETVVTEPDDTDKVWTTVEIQPEFVGGFSEMMKFIAKNTRYPSSARRMGQEGTVFISFVVNADGTITDVQPLKGIQADCDKEAIRVISAMPAWKPGKQNGKAVKVRFVVPIKYKLDR
ncbi:MAG: TonB family protein [Bacteroidota bacterium]